MLCVNMEDLRSVLTDLLLIPVPLPLSYTHAKGGQHFPAVVSSLPEIPRQSLFAFHGTGSRNGLSGSCSCHTAGNQLIPSMRP